MIPSSARAIWFWERIASPHNAGLLEALARQGCDVVYAIEEPMSEERARQGWTVPSLTGVRLVAVTSTADVNTLVASAPSESIHICDGIRANGLVGSAQRALARRGLKQWVVMETVDDSDWRGSLKRLEYRRLFWRWRDHCQGILATGVRTPEWVAARGVRRERVFPFAYFLRQPRINTTREVERGSRFRFAFVGQFIQLKRLELLIAALAQLHRLDFELAVIGSGALEERLRSTAEAALPGRIDWIGRLPLESVPSAIEKVDCLVLPSRHDGWGAVVSEALMVGTPAICSDRCGSAGVVRASGHGGVFRSGNLGDLIAELQRAIEGGRVSTGDRQGLAAWATCLGADAGAGYLLQVFDHVDGKSRRPLPPWANGN